MELEPTKYCTQSGPLRENMEHDPVHVVHSCALSSSLVEATAQEGTLDGQPAFEQLHLFDESVFGPLCSPSAAVEATSTLKQGLANDTFHADAQHFFYNPDCPSDLLVHDTSPVVSTVLGLEGSTLDLVTDVTLVGELAPAVHKSQVLTGCGPVLTSYEHNGHSKETVLRAKVNIVQTMVDKPNEDISTAKEAIVNSNLFKKGFLDHVPADATGKPMTKINTSNAAKKKSNKGKLKSVQDSPYAHILPPAAYKAPPPLPATRPIASTSTNAVPSFSDLKSPLTRRMKLEMVKGLSYAND